MSEETVKLQGGPFDGAEVPGTGSSPLNVESSELPDGMVATYRPTREKGVLRFDGYAKVLARIGKTRA